LSAFVFSTSRFHVLVESTEYIFISRFVLPVFKFKSEFSSYYILQFATSGQANINACPRPNNKNLIW